MFFECLCRSPGIYAACLNFAAALNEHKGAYTKYFWSLNPFQWSLSPPRWIITLLRSQLEFAVLVLQAPVSTHPDMSQDLPNLGQLPADFAGKTWSPSIILWGAIPPPPRQPLKWADPRPPCPGGLPQCPEDYWLPLWRQRFVFSNVFSKLFLFVPPSSHPWPILWAMPDFMNSQFQ